jgi:hypothetical protein
MRAQEIIRAKRDGAVLEAAQIDASCAAWCRAVERGPGGALAMAICAA